MSESMVVVRNVTKMYERVLVAEGVRQDLEEAVDVLFVRPHLAVAVDGGLNVPERGRLVPHGVGEHERQHRRVDLE